MHEMITALNGRIKHKIPEVHNALENNEVRPENLISCFNYK